MTDHPITPPPELVQQWLGDYFGTTVSGEVSDVELVLATRAARWGSDRELDACCEWLDNEIGATDPCDLRAARRSSGAQPTSSRPNLKAQALALIDECTDPYGDYLDDNALTIIRRALNELPDD